jgi:DNA-binding transcriptional ArsR family regulator
MGAELETLNDQSCRQLSTPLVNVSPISRTSHTVTGKAVFSLLHTVKSGSLGDLYNLYILLALAHQEEASSFEPPARGLNLFSISEMTGVPRETVRRRLKVLIEAGYVSEGVDRTYVLKDLPRELKSALDNLGSRLQRVLSAS